MLFWNKRPRWPPSPTAEDELESLSRELHGLTKIGDNPGFEGVCARGSIDQYPLIIETFSYSSIVQNNTLEDPGHGSPSSVDNSGPPTPPSDNKQSLVFEAGDAQKKESQLRPSPLATPPASRDTSPRGQPRAPAPQPVRNSWPTTGRQASPAQPLGSNPQGSKIRKEGIQSLHKARPNPSPQTAAKTSSRPLNTDPRGSKTQKGSTESLNKATCNPIPQKTTKSSSPPLDTKPQLPNTQTDRNQPLNKATPNTIPQKATKPFPPVCNSPVSSGPASSFPKRYESAKSGRPAGPPVTNVQQRTPASGYQLDSAATKTRGHRDSSEPKSLPQGSWKPFAELSRTSSLAEKPEGRQDRSEPKQLPQGSEKLSAGSSKTLSLAERLEEKMRRRHEQKVSGNPPKDAQKRLYTPAPTSVDKPNNPVGVKNEPPAEKQQLPAIQAPRPRLASIATSIDPPSVKKGPSPTSCAGAAMPIVLPADEAKSAPIPPKRTVSFQTEALKPASVKNMENTLELLHSLQNSAPQEAVRPPSPNRSGQCLLPCPRSVPVAGYQDWYTIKGMTHLNICPSCLKQMRSSKFHDLFIPGAPRSRSENIRCSMSEAWTRLAWMQTIKKQLDHLHLLCQITQLPSGSKPCTGRIVNEQFWYRIVNPDTGIFLPKFNVCSACVRNLRILMPPHQDTFKRSTTMQEQVCDFVTDSPRFVRYIDLLDITAKRAEQEHSPQPDVSEFMAYARRKVVLRDCRRNRLALNTWHYMPQLPELTVCEDCYDDVVWPLVKANYPIARKFSAMMRLPPGDELARSREASCQLYSPRMRLKFREAVEENDLAYLSMITMRRYEAEQRYRKQRIQLLADEERGYDCEEELMRNLEEWKRWE